MKLSIILPTYNNYQSLFKGLDYLDKNDFLGIKCEIIVVDDGSDQYTKDKIEQVKSQFTFKLVTNQKNFGKGHAVKSALPHCSGEYIIYTDADAPYHIIGLQDIYKELCSEKYSCVIGNRTHNEDYYSKLPLSRSTGSKIYNILSQIILGLHGLDNQCGLKGFKSDVLKNLFQRSIINRYAFDAEILYRAKHLNYSIKKVNVHLRFSEIGSISIYRDGLKMIIDLFIIRFCSLSRTKVIN